MSGRVENRDERSHRVVGRLVFLGFALIALYFLYAEHRAHLFGALPYLLLAACPLMHLFHHHGRHAHQHDDQASAKAPGPETESRLDGQ